MMFVPLSLHKTVWHGAAQAWHMPVATVLESKRGEREKGEESDSWDWLGRCKFEGG
jgi:hypothetical protein